MSDRQSIILKASSPEEIAEFFGGFAEEHEKSHIAYWRATAMDDPREFASWEKKFTQVQTAKQNAYNKILDILNNPKLSKKYHKKIGPFKSRYIYLTRDGGFYDDILPDGEFVYAVPANIAYKIYPEKLLVAEIVLW